MADRAALVARIDSIVEAELAGGGGPGVSVAITRGQDTIVLRGYGFANLEHGIPVADRTIFRIGSITKQFTAAAVMKLVEAGKVRLDARLSEYLPEYPGPGATVTVHQLLNHTSGIPSYTNRGERFTTLSRLDATHDQVLDLFARDSLEFEPGSRYRYNNSGYYLLGMLIEAVTGEKYADHIRRTQFEPLGLSGTSYCDEARIVPHRASGYARPDSVLVNAEPISMTVPGGAGALCSTGRDLVRWAVALASGQVVSADSYARMTTPTTLTGGQERPYGYGLITGRAGDYTVVQHGGGINGFTAQLSYVPEQQVAIAVLVNSAIAGATAGGLSARIQRAVLGIPEPAESTSQPSTQNRN